MMIEPKLRFEADDGSAFPDWEEKTLSKIAARVTRKNNGNQTDIPLTISSLDWLVDQRDYFKKTVASKDMSGYFLLRNGEFAYNKSYSVGFDYGSIKRLDKYPCGALSTLYICFGLKPNVKVDSGYLAHYFDSQKWNPEVAAICAEGARNHGLLNVPTADFFDINIAVPSLPEQRKIADLLSAVDNAITAQEAEVAAWEKRKKGVMQKLFSQEVRFKADDGSDFPDWESTTVGELFTFVTEKNESGRISDVITNSAEHGLIPQREYFDKDIAVEGNTEGYTVIHKGDFVYNPRKSTIAPFGPFNIYERNEVGIVSPLYTCLTPRDGKTAPYLSWYFKTSRWHRYIVTHGAQGGARHDRVGMTNALMKGIPVMLPSFPEQRKIADCLTSLDDVIAKAKDELDAWCELKKGLLQQMFV